MHRASQVEGEKGEEMQQKKKGGETNWNAKRTGWPQRYSNGSDKVLEGFGIHQGGRGLKDCTSPGRYGATGRENTNTKECRSGQQDRSYSFEIEGSLARKEFWRP